MTTSIEVTVHEKEEDFMGAKYERTFVVAVPVAKAWAAFVDEQEREAWMGGRGERMNEPASLDAFEQGEMKAVDSELHHRFTIAQRPGGLDGWFEMTVTFQEVSSGTQISIVRSGFGDSEAWRHYAESTNGGWDELIADLVLYLETGVRGLRHISFRSGLGATTRQTSAGVLVTYVVPGGFAEHASIRRGDLLLWLNGAPVFRVSDLAALIREHTPGDEIEVEYVRNGEVLRGRAALSPWNYGTGEYIGHPGGFPKASLTGA